MNAFVDAVASDFFRSVVLTLGVFVAITSVASARKTARMKQTIDMLLAIKTDKDYLDGLKHVAQVHSAKEENMRAIGMEGEQSEKARCIRYVLNHFEYVAIGIKHGIYDDRMLREASRGTVLSLYDKALPFIKASREKSGRNTVYKEFERLAQAWDKKPVT